MSIAVMIMAKKPQEGMVKTRLCPPLSPAQATALYHCFLCDKIAQVRSLSGATPALAYAPADSLSFFVELAPDFTLLPQRGDDLTTRLIEAFTYLLATGYKAVIATDSDSPHLPTAYMQQAVDLLAAERADVVLGPSDDGGYYLIGLQHVYHELFTDMPWSTSAVYDETVRRAHVRHLRVATLPTWFDVDTAADLQRLQSDFAMLGDTAPPHTRRFFSAYRLPR